MTFTDEVYSQPPRETLDQSVILADVYFHAVDEVRPGLVLTPTCDFEHGKCAYVQICALFGVDEIISDLLVGSWKKLNLADANGRLVAGPLSAGKRGELTGKVRELITQRFPRYHWLPPFPGDYTPSVIDFQVITSVDPQELVSGGVRILAELRSPFREQVPSRYSAYMSRVGTPDPPQSELDAWVNGTVTSLFPDKKDS